MPKREADIKVKVWGDYACFTRPEFKVERVSYPVVTPSAARGILEAIFWKPEIRYQIREIWVLKLGSQTSILRNEISERQATAPIIVEEKRQQRSSLILKNVAYCILARMLLRPYVDEPIQKYLEQFDRRVKGGQCYHTPYLGTREFAASFGPPGGDDLRESIYHLDIGTMLFDIAYVPHNSRHEMEFRRPGPNGQQKVKGYKHALYFHAKIKNGKLRVPPEKYQELYATEEHHV